VPGSNDGLVRHFQHVHALNLSGQNGRQGFQCAQNGCLRTFTHCRNLKRHIRDKHIANKDCDEVALGEVNIESVEPQEIVGGDPENLVEDNEDVIHGEGVELEDIGSENNGGELSVNPDRSLRVSVVQNVCQLLSRGVVTSAVISEVTQSAREIFDISSLFERKS